VNEAAYYTFVVLDGVRREPLYLTEDQEMLELLD